MTMKGERLRMVIYLAGPYRGKSKIKIINWFQRQINIHRAREAAKRLWAAGFTISRRESPPF